jgi:hypothetical protein
MIAGAMTAAHRMLPFGTRVTVTNRRDAARSSCGSMIAAHSCGTALSILVRRRRERLG